MVIWTAHSATDFYCCASHNPDPLEFNWWCSQLRLYLRLRCEKWVPAKNGWLNTANCKYDQLCGSLVPQFRDMPTWIICHVILWYLVFYVGESRHGMHPFLMVNPWEFRAENSQERWYHWSFLRSRAPSLFCTTVHHSWRSSKACNSKALWVKLQPCRALSFQQICLLHGSMFTPSRPVMRMSLRWKGWHAWKGWWRSGIWRASPSASRLWPLHLASIVAWARMQAGQRACETWRLATNLTGASVARSCHIS